MEAGTHKAKIHNYGIVQNSKGAPQVQVIFDLGGGKRFSWYGGLGSEKQQEITTKNLLTLGATPGNIEKVEAGLIGGVLNMSKEFELVVEDHVYNGKTSQRIKFINDPSASNISSPAFLKNTGALTVLKGPAAAIAAQQGLTSKAQSDTVPF